MNLFQDTHECKVGNHTCDLTSSECINTEGSYKCKCNFGFKKSPTIEDACIGKNFNTLCLNERSFSKY